MGHITISLFPEEAQYLVVVGVVDVNRIWGTLEELPPAHSGGSEQHVGKAEPESNSHHQCEKKLLREHQAVVLGVVSVSLGSPHVCPLSQYGEPQRTPSGSHISPPM